MKQKIERVIALCIYRAFQIGVKRILIAAVVFSVVLFGLVQFTSRETTEDFEPVAVAGPTMEATGNDESDTEKEPLLDVVITPEGNILCSKVPMDERYQCTMQEACRKYDVPYALALGIAQTESGFDFEAYSGIAYGLMQINPINYDWLRENGIEPETYDGNIEAGVYMISKLLDNYTNPHKALMAYNCGEAGAKELWDMGQNDSDYSVKVMIYAEQWAELLGVEL